VLAVLYKKKAQEVCVPCRDVVLSPPCLLTLLAHTIDELTL
jgi:hypothetical protein